MINEERVKDAIFNLATAAGIDANAMIDDDNKFLFVNRGGRVVVNITGFDSDDLFNVDLSFLIGEWAESAKEDHAPYPVPVEMVDLLIGKLEESIGVLRGLKGGE